VDNRYAKRPRTPHPSFYKPKYNIHELSDDIRICDFTCQPDLIFIAEKKPTPPKNSIDAKIAKIG